MPISEIYNREGVIMQRNGTVSEAAKLVRHEQKIEMASRH
jgi:hypothetical protein